jgi:adenylate cyclase
MSLDYFIKNRRNKRITHIALIAICCGLICSLFFTFNIFNSMQLITGDMFFKIPSAIEKDDRIVIVAIDDKSLHELGKFSNWPRSYYAGMVDTLKQSNARVIVFDILFSEESTDDSLLAASMKSAGNVILPVAAINVDAGSPANTTGSQFGQYLRPVPLIAGNAAALGHANVFPGNDGAVRNLSLTVKSENEEVPALALAATSKYLRRPGAPEYSTGNGIFYFAGREIPVADNNEMVINYNASPVNTANTLFQTVSFVDVLKGNVDSRIFNDGIAIIGATASGLGDSYWTPAGAKLNGVEIHASALHTILAGSFVKPAAPGFIIACIFILCLLCGLIVLLVKPLPAALLTLALSLAYIVFFSAAFSFGIMLNPFYPLIGVAGSFTAMSLYNVIWERSRRSLVERVFGHYVSPSVSDQILKGLERNEYRLNGKEQEVTVAFADIRGFSEMARATDAKELVVALNKYLAQIIKTISSHHGIINKFNGDGIMAMWNAPVACKDHPLLAVNAAIEAQKAIRKLQEMEPSLQKMDFGIGISTGMAICGNLGCDDRLEYSAIGVTVNSASRLTSIATGGTVLISEETFQRVSRQVEVKPLGEISIKRENEIYRVYEVLKVYGQTGINEPVGNTGTTETGLRHLLERS